jgi:hypothetical protein
VSKGASCTIGADVTVQHDVKVGEGGSLTDQGASVGHNINADKPSGIAIDGGSVGNDIHINGVTGSGPNTICGTTVGHDLAVENSGSGAGVWDIGNPGAGCAPNSVGHDLNVRKNGNGIHVEGNQVGNNLHVEDNQPGPAEVTGNSVDHDAGCKNNGGQTGSGNTANGHNSCPA